MPAAAATPLVPHQPLSTMTTAAPLSAAEIADQAAAGPPPSTRTSADVATDGETERGTRGPQGIAGTRPPGERVQGGTVSERRYFGGSFRRWDERECGDQRQAALVTRRRSTWRRRLNAGGMAMRGIPLRCTTHTSLCRPTW